MSVESKQETMWVKSKNVSVVLPRLAMSMILYKKKVAALSQPHILHMFRISSKDTIDCFRIVCTENVVFPASEVEQEAWVV